MESAVPRDHFWASLLLELGEVPTHGYDLPALLRPLGLDEMERGFSIARCAAREADGLVASTWDSSPTGPAPRRYSVTPAGKEWGAVASATCAGPIHMATWLSRYRSLRGRGGPEVLPGVSAAS